MIAIITKYHSATTYRAAKIIAKAPNGQRVLVSINDDLTTDQNHLEAAKALCKKMGWDSLGKIGLVQGSLKHCEVFVLVDKRGYHCWDADDSHPSF